MQMLSKKLGCFSSSCGQHTPLMRQKIYTKKSKRIFSRPYLAFSPASIKAQLSLLQTLLMENAYSTYL